MKYQAATLILMLTTVTLFSIFYLRNQYSQQKQKEDQLTIYDWQYCIERTVMKTCDQDDPEDRTNCFKAAMNTNQCYSESSLSISQACLHWWIYFESAQGKDYLPDSFYQCAQDCTSYAQENNFYFFQTYQPMWITCSQQKSKLN